MTGQPKRYRAFISYSQKDKRAALRLHRALESYKLPRGINAHSVDAKTRKLGRFFRDDDEMGAAPALGAALRGAIADAENLIVICSPNAVVSRWVNEEIIHFQQTGRADRIFAIIADGMPNASDAADGAAGECFPAALRQVAIAHHQGSEPFGIDLRKEPFARVTARLAAGLVGIPFDALWRRELRRMRARALRAVAIAISIGCLVLMIAGYISARQEHLVFEAAAREARQENPITAARWYLAAGHASGGWDFTGGTADVSLSSLAPGRMRTIVRRPWMDDIDGELYAPGRNLVATREAEGCALRDAASNWPFATYEACHAMSADGLRIVVDQAGATSLLDIEQGTPIATIGASVELARFSPDGRVVLTKSAGGNHAQVRDAARGEVIAAAIPGDLFIFSPDSRRILSITARTFTWWDARAGRLLSRFESDAFAANGMSASVEIAPDNQTLLIRGERTVLIAASGQTLRDFGEAQATYSARGRIVIAAAEQRREGTAPIMYEIMRFDPGNGAEIQPRLYDIEQWSAAPNANGFVAGQWQEGGWFGTFTTWRLYRAWDLSIIASLEDDTARSSMSENGAWLATVERGERVHLRSASTGAPADMERATFGTLPNAPAQITAFFVTTAEAHWASWESVFATSIVGPFYIVDTQFSAPVGLARRGEVCAANYFSIGPFSEELRNTRALRGRPWNPCDWRGIFTAEGIQQFARLLGVRWLGWRDYACAERTAFAGADARLGAICEDTPRRFADEQEGH